MRGTKAWRGVPALLLLILLITGCGGANSAAADAVNLAQNTPIDQVGQEALQEEGPQDIRESPQGTGEEPAEDPVKDKTEKAVLGTSGTSSQDLSPEPAQDPDAPSDLSPDTLTTTLEEGAVQKGSKKTIEVQARDGQGNKIPQKEIRVTLNGREVPATWDDGAKTSYTLLFSQKGLNTVLITAGNARKTYAVSYEPAPEGADIGQVVISVEAFTIQGGYLVNPLSAEIKEGENGAQLLDRVLKAQGYSYENTGSLKANFYLAALHGGVLPLKAAVPGYLKDHLLQNGFALNEEDDLYAGGLGEFNYTQGSGWMYCVNHKFPNVGLSDYYPAAGDVFRLQFTLAYGLDIGGSSAAGYSHAADYYPVADKDKLTAAIAAQGWGNVAEGVREVVTKLNASQEEVDEAVRSLKEGTD